MYAGGGGSEPLHRFFLGFHGVAAIFGGLRFDPLDTSTGLLCCPGCVRGLHGVDFPRAGLAARKHSEEALAMWSSYTSRALNLKSVTSLTPHGSQRSTAPSRRTWPARRCHSRHPARPHRRPTQATGTSGRDAPASSHLVPEVFSMDLNGISVRLRANGVLEHGHPRMQRHIAPQAASEKCNHVQPRQLLM